MRTLSLLALPLLAGVLLAGDWPQWRGADGTAVSAEKGLLKVWPKAGPKLAWKTDQAGQGYAGLAVAGGAAYTMGAFGEDEYALAFDAAGKPKWKTKLGPVHDWKENRWSYGPNATPAVGLGRVYALSSKGMLACLDVGSGKIEWTRDLPVSLAGEVNPKGGGEPKFGWGYSWSPQLDGERLVLTPGGPKGLFAAVNAKTGADLWRSTTVTDQATYSTPAIATIGGTRQYIAVTQKAVVAVDARTGAQLWRAERDDEYPDVVCPTPVVSKDRVYVSVGYGGGLDCLKVAGKDGKFTVTKEWTSKRSVSSKQGGVALVGDHLYGYHEDRQWACADVSKNGGPNTWKAMTPALKAGGFVVADGRLYVLDEEGKVALVEASPAKFNLISSFKLPAQGKNPKEQGKVWAHPSLSDGKLYLRDQELIFVYEVK